ncbi:MAG: hypothetical protein ACTSVV_06060 [Promethearchaeota archaeon]
MSNNENFDFARRIYSGITKEQIEKWRNDLVTLVQTEVLLRQLRNKGTKIVLLTQALIDIQIAYAFINVGSLRAVRELIDCYLNGIIPYFDWVNMITNEQWIKFQNKIAKYTKREIEDNFV